MRKLTTCSWILAILLSNIMCAVVAWNYCDMQWGESSTQGKATDRSLQEQMGVRRRKRKCIKNQDAKKPT